MSPETYSSGEKESVCRGKLSITSEGWQFEPEPGSNCQETIESMKGLPPATRAYLGKHMVVPDPQQEAPEGANAERKDSCAVELVITGKGWELRPEPRSECAKALQNLEELGPAAKQYVCRHIDPADPQQKAKMNNVCRIKPDQ